MTQPTPTPTAQALRVFSLFVFSMTGAYGLSVSGFLALRVLIGEQANGVALMNNLLHLLVLPSLVLLPLALVLRRWLLLILLVLPFAFGLSSVLPLYVPAQAAPPATAQTVSVLSYNLLAHERDFSAATDIIRAQSADIVALQEVTFGAARAVADLYPYSALHPKPIGTQGQAILSRYPILEDAFFQNEGLSVVLGHQRSVLDVEGVRVVVYNVHMIHPGMTQLEVAQRSADVAGVLARATQDAQTNPVLLMGDFNLTPYTADYAALSAHFTDAYRQAGTGLGYTFPVMPPRAPRLWRLMPPLARIDYIFHTPTDWLALDAHVLTSSGGSDHLPLAATLALTARQP